MFLWQSNNESPVQRILGIAMNVNMTLDYLRLNMEVMLLLQMLSIFYKEMLFVKVDFLTWEIVKR